MAEKEFNPSDHLLDLRGKDYLPVAWRIYWLRDKHPGAQLTTELVEHSPGHAIFRAEVVIPGTDLVRGASATGYGSETQEDFGDYLEKAETKAIGRALAALGFGTQFCDDFAEDSSVTDAPVHPTPSPRKSGRTDGREPTPSEPEGQARHALRQVLTTRFGRDEKATFDFMEATEPAAIKGTGINYAAITGERCREIIAIVEEPPKSAEPEMPPEEPA